MRRGEAKWEGYDEKQQKKQVRIVKANVMLRQTEILCHALCWISDLSRHLGLLQGRIYRNAAASLLLIPQSLSWMEVQMDCG